MLKQKRKLILLVLSLGLVMAPVILPLFAEARGLVPCGGYNDDGTREPACTIAHTFILIARVTNWLIAMAGIYAVFQIVSAGFWLVVTSGNEENIAKWRKGLVNAVIGFFIVMAAYMFMNTVINGILAQEEPGKTVNFNDPICYITNGKQCLIDKK